MKRLTLFATLILPLSYGAPVFAGDLAFTGTARQVDGGDVIYKENHAIAGRCEQGVFVPEQQIVEYSRPGSEGFATKKLSYQQSVLRPSLEFNQPDFSEVIEVTNRDDEILEVLWQAPFDSTELASLEVKPSLVVDSGFDNLVRKNWKKVVGNGESVRFNLVVPARGDYYGFILEPTSDSRIEAEHLVRIRPSGTLMGFLVDPILLGYNKDGLLTDYLGLTNIRKNEDTNYIAHIRYTIEATPECKLMR